MMEVVPLGPVSGTSPPITLAMATRTNALFTCRVTATTTFVFSGFTTAGQWAELRVQQPTGGAAIVTLPSAIWPNGATGVVTPAANAVDRFGFMCMGGSSVDAFILGNNIRTPL